MNNLRKFEQANFQNTFCLSAGYSFLEAPPLLIAYAHLRGVQLRHIYDTMNIQNHLQIQWGARDVCPWGSKFFHLNAVFGQK